MKNITLYASLIIGFILLYVLDVAFQIRGFGLEALLHNLVRFFVGFAVLGIWGWSKHQLKFKMTLYMILAFLISDDIYDYFNNIDNLSFESLIYDAFIILWGAISGYLFVKTKPWHKGDDKS